MTQTSGPRTGMLSCLTWQDKVTSKYLAHCLNYDLMECGSSPDEAWANLKICIKQYVEYCNEFRPEGLNISATADEWKEFAEALKLSTKPDRIDTIDIEVRPPLQESNAIWMQGVSNDVGAALTVQ
jgi:hypothetical protein